MSFATLLRAGALVLLLASVSFGQAIVNGDFSNPSGAPWVFDPDYTDSTVSYATGAAVVTGSYSFSFVEGYDWIRQDFAAAPGVEVTLTFDWSYACGDEPEFDAAVYDVIDTATGISAVGGPIFLADTAPASGTETRPVSGSGSYTLRLGTWTLDALLAPGIATFDNVVVDGAISGNPFVRGDANVDGVVDITDGVFVLGVLFVPGHEPLACDDAADTNDDGVVDVSDGVFVLAALFVPGAPWMPAPTGGCGGDATADDLGCEGAANCP